MTTGARFDIEAIRDLVAAGTFARGEAYHRGGQVEILALGPEHVLARVTGTQDYSTQLVGRGDIVGGQCSCPAFDNQGFCKHMVATALAANAVWPDGAASADDALSRIRDHLRSKDVDALAQMVLGLALRDRELFRKLDIAASMSTADDKTLEERLRKALDAATRTRGFVDYAAAPGWAAEVDAALDLIGDLPAGRGKVALGLAVRAIERIERAVEALDDSDGHCGALLARAQQLHLEAARAAPPEPVRFARELFVRETEDEYGVFDGAVALYADVLGAEGLAEYRRLAEQAWNAPARPGGTAGGEGAPDNYRELASILDFFAERDGDVELRIALRAKDLSSPWAYLQLAKFCLSIGRREEALRRAEEGLWVFEDRPDPRLLLFAARLLSEADRPVEAEAHLWRAFEKAPSLELYAALRKLAGERATGRAVTMIETRLADRTAGFHRGPADLLVGVLMHDQLFDEAWAVVRKHGVSASQGQALAEASWTTHPREAIAVFGARVDQLANAGGNAAYAEAVALVARIASLQDAAEQTAYVGALKARFAKKRNFMRLLG